MKFNGGAITPSIAAHESRLQTRLTSLSAGWLSNPAPCAMARRSLSLQTASDSCGMTVELFGHSHDDFIPEIKDWIGAPAFCRWRKNRMCACLSSLSNSKNCPDQVTGATGCSTSHLLRISDQGGLLAVFSTTGSSAKNFVPTPISDSKQTCPFMRSTSSLVIANPSPVPPFWRVSEESAWENF